jgi:UDP-N-acetylglucosamine:LPS N-acetylglucosamine transferase
VSIHDAGLTGDVLVKTLTGLLDDAPRRSAMSQAMRAWSKPDAAKDAASAILEIAKKKERGAAAPLRQAA